MSQPPPAPEPTGPAADPGVELRCWCCRTTLVVPADRVGKEIGCPQCLQLVKVPAPAAAPAPAVGWARWRLAGGIALNAAIVAVVGGVLFLARPDPVVQFVLLVGAFVLCAFVALGLGLWRPGR